MFKPFQFISPAHTYTCPICAAQFDEYESAQKCTESHAMPKSLIGFEGFCDVNNTSTAVYVELADGRTAMYGLCHIVAGEEQDA
jgi:hypothetical protein